MFGKKHKVVSDIDTLIGENTVIIGDIQFSGGLRVDGRISGSIVATGSEPHSLLVLSTQGIIEGKIKVPHLVINGVVNGPVHSSENLELQPGAKVTGDIYYKTLKIHQGAMVEGKMVCHENTQPEKLITYVASTGEQEEKTDTSI